MIGAVPSREELETLAMLAVVVGRKRSAAQAAAGAPAALIMLFMVPLWALGLAFGKDRRAYVIKLSKYAMRAVSMLLRGQSGAP